MSETSGQGGFGYWVSDEQLEAYSRLTPMQRLQWVDQARRFTLLGRTRETAQRQEWLREGKTIRGE